MCEDYTIEDGMGVDVGQLPGLSLICISTYVERVNAELFHVGDGFEGLHGVILVDGHKKAHRLIINHSLVPPYPPGGTGSTTGCIPSAPVGQKNESHNPQSGRPTSLTYNAIYCVKLALSFLEASLIWVVQ